ncbi:MAG: ECF-type sigma factor [Planctomycetota bacterium]
MAGVSSLFARLYDRLYSVADDCLRRGRDHSLQPAGVVHEAYLRLVDCESLGVADRSRFLAAAARTMRQVVVDHARRRRAHKRGGGGGWQRITWCEAVAPVAGPRLDLLALDQALDELAAAHPRAAKIVELRFFGGMAEREIAAHLSLSRTTVQGEWRFARAWLHEVVDG